MTTKSSPFPLPPLLSSRLSGLSTRLRDVGLRGVLAAVACVHLVLVFSPWGFAAPELGSESSWAQVIGHAAALDWQWGRDILFTYGPLGYIRFPVIGEAPLLQAFCWNAIVLAVFVWAVIELLRGVRTGWALVLYAAIVFAGWFMTGKGIYTLLPIFVALLYFREPTQPRRALLLAVASAAGVVANAYAPVLVTGLLTCILLDVARLVRRSRVEFVPAFVVGVVASFILANQSIALLPAFLRSELEFIGGYGDAASIDGPASDILAFLVCSTVAAALLLVSEWRRLGDRRERIGSLALLGAIGATWFVAWKGGFVRHDAGHSSTAWATVGIMLAGYAAARVGRVGPRLVFTTLCLLAVAFSLVAAGRALGTADPASIAREATEAFVSAPVRALRSGVESVTGPGARQEWLRMVASGAHERIRKARPDIVAQGTVDLIGPEQAAVLAHGLDYRPQPSFEPYNTYTRWLIDFNREHLRGTTAATTAFLSSAALDDHYPLADLGASITELLGYYRPTDLAGAYLRMSRRQAPLASTTAEISRAVVPLGKWVDVAGGADLVMLEADVQPSILGRLQRLAWRSPAIALTVRFADGSEKAHRIVPAIAATGFLLSPYAASIETLAAQLSGHLDAKDPARVIAFKIDTAEASGRRFFDDSAAVRLVRWSLATVTGEREVASPAIERFFGRRATVKKLASSGPKGQVVEARRELLFAHAPATTEIPVAAASSVHLRYGIFESAWTGDQHTDGVCFRVRAVPATGPSTVLHERCLIPLEQPGDRAEQEVTLQVTGADPVKLVLETDCRITCASDWSYWKDIDVTAPSAAASAAAPPLLDRTAAVTRLANSVAGKGQLVEARGTLLFAHPAAKPSLELPSLHALRVSYGIFEGAWSAGAHTDGVCFRVWVATPGARARKLHEQCLTPVERASDRTDQHFSTRLAIAGPVTLTLETDCRRNCAWDWAYWKDIDITP